MREYATDDTEGLRLRTLAAFASLAGDRLERSAIAAEQRLGLDGLTGRIDSASYLPKEGERAAQLRERARALFEQFEQDGTVVLAMTYHVLTAAVA